MMAEKAEMKRTLLQHDLCRIQVFSCVDPSVQTTPARTWTCRKTRHSLLLYVLFSVARSFVTTLLTYSPAYTITEADWYYPPGLPLLQAGVELHGPLHSATRSACEINELLVSPKIRHLFSLKP